MGSRGGPPATLGDSVYAFRLRVIARANVPGNITQAWGEVGISCTLFYRWHRCCTAYGTDSLHPPRPAEGPPIGSQPSGRAIMALAWPN